MDVRFRGYQAETSFAFYTESGERSLQLIAAGGEPLVTATVALWPPSPVAAEGYVWLKTWSECEGLPMALQLAGVVELLDQVEPAGFAVAQLARLTPAAMQEAKARFTNPGALLALQAARARTYGRRVAPEDPAPAPVA